MSQLGDTADPAVAVLVEVAWSQTHAHNEERARFLDHLRQVLPVVATTPVCVILNVVSPFNHSVSFGQLIACGILA